MTTLDCWLTILSMLLGVCIWTFLGGIVTTLLIHLNAASSEYTAKITALNQYMTHRKLPQVWQLQYHAAVSISCDMACECLVCSWSQSLLYKRFMHAVHRMTYSCHQYSWGSLTPEPSGYNAASLNGNMAIFAGAAAEDQGQLRGALEGREAL